MARVGSGGGGPGEPVVRLRQLTHHFNRGGTILAVRDELEHGLGEVDTLSRFAQRVKQERPQCKKSMKQLRRMASEQLTKAPGPSSVLARYVLDFVVSDERRRNDGLGWPSSLSACRCYDIVSRRQVIGVGGGVASLVFWVSGRCCVVTGAQRG